MARTLLLSLATAASLAACFVAQPARAWWVYGPGPRIGIIAPPIVVGPPVVYGPPVAYGPLVYGPPVVYGPPPVVVGPPPVAYAPPPRVWAPGGWVRGVWVPPHWS